MKFARIPTMLALLCVAGLATAQDYPSRPLRFIVPFAPGGGADVIARIINEPLAKQLGQPVIIDNKPGGGATIGADFVAKSPPDGYTILYGTPGPQIINPFLMAKLPYDPVADLAPVAALIVVPNLLVVHPSVPATSVKELIDYARANPGKVNFSSAGIGASSHLSGELFKHAANIQITHVPYKGSGAAMQDLLGGNVQMAIDSLPVLLPQIRSNKLRALAVSTRERSPVVPEIPTIADTLPGFDASAMNYIAVRGGTPRPIIERLNRAVNAVLASPDLRERLLGIGATPLGGTSDALAATIIAEREKWKKVIDVSGAKAE